MLFHSIALNNETWQHSSKLLTMCFFRPSERVLCYFSPVLQLYFSTQSDSLGAERANFLIISITDPKKQTEPVAQKSINSIRPKISSTEMARHQKIIIIPYVLVGSNQVIQLGFNKWFRKNVHPGHTQRWKLFFRVFFGVLRE